MFGVLRASHLNFIDLWATDGTGVEMFRWNTEDIPEKILPGRSQFSCLFGFQKTLTMVSNEGETNDGR
ncbi:unnamed protein product [Acanthoscelides obtectus]|uniref:Uncharacterized protein n=1 Tax=Acanthoscelides obtectus TaxID=200917 RepID=A0A9P0M3S0_ACAOB|nr:unnamed protein product [Acanthoscelides obtectus]CAK1656489.1 hypothetical protein AOBTE_LOCUS19743 [Acanthoscelides obtectus]